MGISTGVPLLSCWNLDPGVLRVFITSAMEFTRYWENQSAGQN